MFETYTLRILFLCCIPLTTLCSHFLGGNIMIRPSPPQSVNVTDQHLLIPMEITSHYSLTRRGNSCYTRLWTFNCQYGCRDSVNISSFCIEDSTENDWLYWEGHEIHIFNITDINAVTVGDVASTWVWPFYGYWNISVTFSLIPRTDTGKINSSPRVAGFFHLDLLEGYHYNISLAVIDPDGDNVRCRWASGRECYSVCNRIPGAVLDSNSCMIRYHANFGTGLKAVAIMIEDFLPSSTVPLSSVAHQFIVEVVDISRLSCASHPWFITALQDTCILSGTLYTGELVANSGCSNVSITSIQIIAPIGASKGELQHIVGTNNYYTNITWTPTANQQNDTHILCYIAVSSENLTSEQSCIKLAVYHPPSPLHESATPCTPNHQFVYPSNSTLQIMFDKKIQRPSTPAFIRFYKSREVVYQIDTLSSLEVNFDGQNLAIVPNYIFSEGNTYYVNFDEGVVESIEGCHLGNVIILNETFWTFEVLNLIPDVVPVNNQTVGQPLILQCSVTTIRDINSRVDFVWINNGTELERIEGVIGESSTNNLAVYRDYYIISQLSIADNNSLYTCEVIINRSSLTSLSATGNFTLYITDDDHDSKTPQPCTLPPRFVNPTSPQRECVIIRPGMHFVQQIMATSSCSNVTSIQVSAPDGTSVGELQHVQGTNDYYVNVTWIPTANQQNKSHFLCSVAVNVAGLSSELFCMQLAAGYLPPTPSPYHQVVYPSHNTLYVMFDKTIQRPSTSAFIIFYKLGEEVYHIDVSSSSEVMFTESSLTIMPKYSFNEGSTYYINADRGVVQTVYPEGCLLVNEPILSSTFWTLEVVSFESVFTSSVSVTALSSQTVGQPLILQCNVTTIRDINSRVDFVWISNGRELERVEGVIGELSTDNLAVYGDYYIIPQLSITDNNSLYTCEVIINRSPLISASSNVTLYTTETNLLMDTICECDDQDNDYIFIILLAISATSNLLIGITALTYCLRRIHKKDGVKKTQHNAEASESVTYENFLLQRAKLSAAQQHVKPMAENNENMHYNPVYLAVGNP